VSRYDWDPEKARVNLLKHGVLFEEAEEMLQNAQSEERPDATHSFGDVRIRTIGYTARSRLIVVITSIGGPRPRSSRDLDRCPIAPRGVQRRAA